MKIIVQKFGGTSLTSYKSRDKAIEKIDAAVKKGFIPVVVVSAMGRKGEPYATDTFIQMSRKINREIKAREQDLLISCGEIISAVIMTAQLNAKGLDAVAMTGQQSGIITDNHYGNASILRVEPKKIYQHIERGKIPVITGFQGATEYGDTTTLGRGGSDVTAAVLGEVLKAHSVEIYTDVDGVMTADPRIISGAKVIQSMDYNEMFQMADYGAKIIHPRAAEIAMKSNVPLVIKNTFSDSPGTLITHFKKEGDTISMGDRGLLTGIAHMHDRAQVVIDYSECPEKNYTDNILDKLADMGISIDLINIFTDKKIFTIDEGDCDKVIHLLEKGGAAFSINKGCSKVTVIGSRIRGVPGVMARILRILNQNKIGVYQTADSHATISVLVKRDQAEKAAIILHDEFKL